MRVLYFLIWCLLGPLFMVLSLGSKSLRYAWTERWGFRLPKSAPGTVWIHAASLGEGQAAAALFSALRRQSTAVFLRTATSRAGLEQAQGQELCCALPLDAPWVVSRWLDRVRPRVLILVESELWPHLLIGCAKRGIPVLVVNGRLGRGQRRFAKWAPRLYQTCQEAIVLWSCVSEQDVEWLADRGPIVRVDGDLKAGAPLRPFPIGFTRRVFVGASTRKGDEARLLAVVSGLDERCTLVIAPRRLERLPLVLKLLGESGLSHVLLSKVEPGSSCDLDVLLVDQFGLLPSIFPLANAAFVGGTFDPVIGGHSPAEAARFGLALVCGPEFHSHAGLWAKIPHRVSGQDLGEAFRWAMDESGPVETEVTDRSAPPEELLAALSPFLQGPVPPERSGHRRILMPVAWVWKSATAFRNLIWNRRTPKFTGCVISVGSLSAGGTGKTAVTLYLAQRIQESGRKVTVVSRGYKRAKGPKIRLATQGLAADFLGDELAMVAARGIEVISAPDRVAGALLAFEKGAEVVILDDGFQHRRLGRSLDIVVIDAQWPRGGGPMPVGSEREGPKSLTRAGAVWVHGGILPASMESFLPSGIPKVSGELSPVCWLNQGQSIPLETLKAKPVRAFAGIGRPGRFLSSLLAIGVDVVEWRAFSDHHVFSPKEIEELRAWSAQGLLVTTEKDWPRLPNDLPVWVLRMEMRPTSGIEPLFEEIERAIAG
jgi:tetraacyldisaccharide 4'-kinase